MLPTLEDFGIDEKAVLVELSKETMAKLIAAEKTTERLRAALQWIADQVDNEDGDLDDIILCANKALAHEQRAP